MSNNELLDQQNELRKMYKENTYLLGKDLLGFKDMTVDFHYNKLCKKLMEPRKKRIRLFLVPRGFLKTTTLTITDSIALQLRTPSIRLAIISAVLANAKSMVTAIGLPYLTNPRFRMLYEKFCPKKPQAPETKWTGAEIEVPNRYCEGGHPVMESTFEAFGADSTLTSRHFDYIKVDDLVTGENCTTKEQMDKVKDFWKRIFPLRNSPDTPIDVIGTRWDDYDLYGELEKDPDIEVIKFAAGLTIRKPLWPERYPLEELAKIKSGPKMGAYLFSCLYEMEPVPQEEAIFKDKYFRYFTIAPDRRTLTREDGAVLEINQTYMTVDGATEEGKNDYSCIMIGMMDHKQNIYLLDHLIKQVDPTTLIEKMYEYYEKWHCIKYASQKALVEKMLQAFMKKKLREEKKFMNFVPLQKNTVQNKEWLIKQLQPWYEGGYIWHNENMRDGEHESQLVRFPKAKNDNGPDTEQMLLEILVPSSKRKIVESLDRNSLEMWKRRLKRALQNDSYEGSRYVVNERTY